MNRDRGRSRSPLKQKMTSKKLLKFLKTYNYPIEPRFSFKHSFNFVTKVVVVSIYKKGRNLFICIGVVLLLATAGFAQKPVRDTTIFDTQTLDKRSARPSPTDTVAAKAIDSKVKNGEPEHSPKKASVYSAILPGLGQAYNKKYWKIPLVYGGFAAFGYFIGWNNKNYITSQRAYSDLTDDDPTTESYLKLKQIIHYDLKNASDVTSLKQGLVSSQDYYRRNRDLLIIVTAAFYGLNIIDASVDAHFFNFDISDDLTLNLEPTVNKMKDQHIFCLNCTFHF
jgi:hypothetical protein